MKRVEDPLFYIDEVCVELERKKGVVYRGLIRRLSWVADQYEGRVVVLREKTSQEYAGLGAVD